MLLVRCAGHYEVGSHGGRSIACFYRFESRAGLALWQGRKQRVGAWRAEGGEGPVGVRTRNKASSEDKQPKQAPKQSKAKESSAAAARDNRLERRKS
jgi:hypothetical protein